MPILDNSIVFSDQQVVTASAASTNSYDFFAPGTVFGDSQPLTRDIGRGFQVPLLITVVQTFNNCTSLQVQLQKSPDNVTWSTFESGRDVPLANLVAGFLFKSISEIPEGSDNRYLRLFYQVTGTAPTTGKITAAAATGRQTNYTYGGH